MTGVWCLAQKGNNQVPACNGSVEMGSKVRMGCNVVTGVSYPRSFKWSCQSFD